MNNGKVAVIGDKDLILAFKAAGMDVFCAKDAQEAEKTVKKLTKDYAVIFITEDLAAQIEQTIDKYRDRAYPAIVPIPSSAGASGYGMRRISRDVEMAVGTDILFNKED